MHRRAVASVTLALFPALLVGGCAGDREVYLGGAPPAATEVPRPALAEGVFPVAEAEISQAPVPERFDRELPTSPAELAATWHEYPAAHLRKRLCAGDPEVAGRLARAAAAAAAGGATPEQLRAAYGHLLEWCRRPEACAWARRAVADGEPVAALAWVALARCGPEVEELFDDPAAPAGLVVEYWSERSWQEEEYVPRFRPAVAAAIGPLARAGETMLARRGALLLGRSGDPRAAAALLSLHDELPDGEPRDAILPALGDLDDPRARRLFDEYCARPEQRDPVCRGDWASTGDEEPDEPPAAGPDPGPDPETAALAARLEAIGLIPPGSAAGVTEPGLTAEAILMHARAVECFDVETGQFPNEHDALLYDLAALAGPPFAAAVFEESSPPMELGDGRWLVDGREVESPPEGAAPGDPYHLRAWLDGRVYAVDAQDFGDWYDLDQVLGLLNAIAVDRGAAARFVATGGDGQFACVLAAPREAILAALAEGLIEVAGAGDAMREGREFEQQVLERLRSGELELE